jgi:hypothetical protein
MPLDAGAVDRVVRELAETFTGPQLTSVLASARLSDPLGEGATKWKRVASAVSAEGANAQVAVLRLIEAAMQSSRWPRADLHDQTRRTLNEVLAFAGAELRADGKLYERKVARTHDEAMARTRRLREELQRREGHSEIFRFCTRELVQEDCFGAVFEAVKGSVIVCAR